MPLFLVDITTLLLLSLSPMVRLTRATLFPLALMHVGAGDPGLPANAGGHRRLSTGISASARVPSGAPTGSREARELRDGDQGRYRGRGVLAAVGSVNSELADLILGRSWQSLAEADQAMIDLDGTADKSRLGANATVGVSMALARSLADSAGQPLWWWLAPWDVTPSLPVPHFNVVNGGRHVPNSWTSRNS